jgi:hypothetical protein
MTNGTPTGTGTGHYMAFVPSVPVVGEDKRDKCPDCPDCPGENLRTNTAPAGCRHRRGEYRMHDASNSIVADIIEGAIVTAEAERWCDIG